MVDHWVVCVKGSGYLYENDKLAHRRSNFPEKSVGWLKSRDHPLSVVWLIGRNETYAIENSQIEPLDVLKTGDKYAYKICNMCHCLKLVEHFARNQNNKHGLVRRPSCIKCRTDIDKRAPKTRQARLAEKARPITGSYFKCPICQRRSIVGITAKIVADHDHHTGNIRDFICDSCNTGLGRFKNGEDYLMNAVEYIREREVLK